MKQIKPVEVKQNKIKGWIAFVVCLVLGSLLALLAYNRNDLIWAATHKSEVAYIKDHAGDLETIMEIRKEAIRQYNQEVSQIPSVETRVASAASYIFIK